MSSLFSVQILYKIKDNDFVIEYGPYVSFLEAVEIATNYIEIISASTGVKLPKEYTVIVNENLHTATTIEKLGTKIEHKVEMK